MPMEAALKASPFLAVLVVVVDLITGSAQRHDVTTAVNENTHAIYKLTVDIDGIESRVAGHAEKNKEQDVVLRELERQVDRMETVRQAHPLPPYGSIK